jgi:hypothetical protein
MVLLKLSLEVAVVNTASAKADVTKMAFTAWGDVVNRSLKVQLVPLLHERK